MRLLVALIAALHFGLASTVAAAEHWLLVDTTAATLTLMNGESPVAVHENIAIGRNGTSRNRVLDDGRTPLGVYHINSVREESRFHRFFTFDFPNLYDARDALAAGTIDKATYLGILDAHEHGRAPPQDTPLGGNLGIHGTGSGDIRIHGDFNWTDGCIALTNQQIDDLTPYVFPGMIVVVQ